MGERVFLLLILCRFGTNQFSFIRTVISFLTFVVYRTRAENCMLVPLQMEKREPSLVPEWLRSKGNGSGVGSKNHIQSSSARSGMLQFCMPPNSV